MHEPCFWSGNRSGDLFTYPHEVNITCKYGYKLAIRKGDAYDMQGSGITLRCGSEEKWISKNSVPWEPAWDVECKRESFLVV